MHHFIERKVCKSLYGLTAEASLPPTEMEDILLFDVIGKKSLLVATKTNFAFGNLAWDVTFICLSSIF